MIPSRIAHNLALMRYTRMLLRFKMSAEQAEELTAGVDEIVRTAVQELRAEIEAERDDARKKFFAAHPNLTPLQPNVSTIVIPSPNS